MNTYEITALIRFLSKTYKINRFRIPILEIGVKTFMVVLPTLEIAVKRAFVVFPTLVIGL
jgi:hypothetical protein